MYIFVLQQPHQLPIKLQQSPPASDPSPPMQHVQPQRYQLSSLLQQNHVSQPMGVATDTLSISNFSPMPKVWSIN